MLSKKLISNRKSQRVTALRTHKIVIYVGELILGFNFSIQQYRLIFFPFPTQMKVGLLPKIGHH